MKNLKVSMKLISGFMVVILLAAAVGVSGLIGLNSMSGAAESMYADMGVPLGDLGLATEYFQRVRVQLRNAIIYTGDAGNLATVEADLTDRMQQFEDDMTAYGPTIVTEEGQNLFKATMDEFNRVMKPGVTQLMKDAGAGMTAERLLEEIAGMTAAADTIANNLRQLTQMRLNVMSDANDGTTRMFTILLVVIIAAIVIAVGAALILAFYISGLISKPLIQLAAFMKQAGSTGDIVLKEEDKGVISEFAQRKDEIGQTIGSAAEFFNRLNVVSGTLKTISGGDLTVEIAPLTDKDTLGVSLETMSKSLNAMFGEVNASTEQVSAGASQVADGAQALAAGATQQAASVEELSSSIAEITTMTKANTKNATNVLADVQKAARYMEECLGQMGEMMEAMRAIDEKSQNISRTTKVINDIAFQTNILALNAAVEAARAGQHGKGFAVVADEVRSLAAKSAEAAKETEALIESSAASVAQGNTIVEKVNESLQAVGEISRKNAEEITELQTVSVQQSEAMEQVDIGIEQISQVVQQNSATAEESAAAAEEMSSQSAVLRQLVARFKVKSGGLNAHGQARKMIGAAKGYGPDGYADTPA